MEILVRGTPQADRLHEARCTSCKSVVRFRESEGVKGLDRNDLFIKIGCPVCGADIIKDI